MRVSDTRLVSHGAGFELRFDACQLSYCAQVLETLDGAERLGLRVLRIWAFCDGQSQWNCLQRAPGDLDERVLGALDWLLAEAHRRGLRLLFTLTNWWEDYGGVPAYITWSSSCGSKDAFFSDPDCRRWFRGYVSALASRRSTVDGLVLGAHPAVFAWDLCNEPRCPSDPSGALFLGWLAEMAAHLRSLLAPGVPITVGLEGFDPRLPSCPAWARGLGVPWAEAAELVDFASLHIWPDQWDTQQGGNPGAWCRRWIREHAELLHGKQLLVSEFGCKREWRETVIPAVLDESARWGASCLLWMIACDSYPDYDEYTLHLGDLDEAMLRRWHAPL